jgi:hypothetical protein
VYGAGGIKKSALLTPLPAGVRTYTCPDEAVAGTLLTRVVLVAEETPAKVRLNSARLLKRLDSKFVPVIVTLVPDVPIVGVNPVTVGAPEAPTTNEVLVVAAPAGEVTLIGPVVAPAGTLVTIWVAVAEVTLAGTPLKATVF